ncbi:ADP-ribose glycohydrolase ARH3-like isoform X1 [Dendronephthya gigantea]|uniref:ADP-ribose glycohydrolase ARH3-like isoform X1 n=1 Tax=Dendronephthya gigantea TaxID=151771 RepID=UPI00106D2FDB|nr:ADP-ribose glycohydrolase ARH3-like isoform X1 [Dendronephthya gigantea]
MAAVSSVKILRSKFSGCLLGALFGDALGAEFEGYYWMSPVPEWAFEVFSEEKLLNFREMDKPRFKFTDDSAMMMALCRSLLSEKTLNIKKLAREYTETFYREPYRGYGGGVRSVFRRLRDETFKDVTLPAREQFDGSGSYGNGAAMRVAPIALFNHDNLEELKKNSAQNALVTHAHAHGINGAVLQAMAVYESLQTPPGTLDVEGYIDKMIAAAEELERVDVESVEVENVEVENVELNEPAENSNICDAFSRRLLYCFTLGNSRSNDEGRTPDEEQRRYDIYISPKSYVDQFRNIKEMLVGSKGNPSTRQVINTLGTGIKAIEAVPAAIFSFLYKSDACVKDVLFYAMSLGGDTDTIACMAGAIAGAYWGRENIPEDWYPVTEGVEKMTQYADELYELRVPQSTG